RRHPVRGAAVRGRADRGADPDPAGAGRRATVGGVGGGARPAAGLGCRPDRRGDAARDEIQRDSASLRRARRGGDGGAAAGAGFLDHGRLRGAGGAEAAMTHTTSARAALRVGAAVMAAVSVAALGTGRAWAIDPPAINRDAVPADGTPGPESANKQNYEC